jgi:A/G-specific adenine glycosylase
MSAVRGPAARAALEGFDSDGFRAAVLLWYDAQGRTFPFRGTTDPYLVLVSETILQQTQVSRGAPAWAAFTARFPTVEVLAAATPADVIRAWAGLGYNRRALNLHRAARIVTGELGGRFPRDVAGLERLPGVGPYTARAVASIAYGVPVGAVDTNVRRVLGRSVAGHVDRLTARDLQAVADALAPLDRPADWTHALMDVGSTRCRPRAPRCEGCPARPFCRHAAAEGAATVGVSPQRLKPGAVRERPAAFSTTSRWLRGRILDRLRAVDGEGWATFEGPLGEHPPAVVAEALRALAAEGLVELGPGPAEGAGGILPAARLPLA